MQGPIFKQHSLKSPLVSRQRKRICGQTTVEFALIMPFVSVLLLAAVEFGWVIENSMTLANTARETARTAALGLATPAIGTAATNMASPLKINTLTMTYSSDNGATWQAWPADTVTGTTTNNGVPSGALININVTAYDIALTGIIPQINNILITQKEIMTRE
jgi:Flp pilus assembly protein TadG